MEIHHRSLDRRPVRQSPYHFTRSLRCLHLFDVIKSKPCWNTKTSNSQKKQVSTIKCRCLLLLPRCKKWQCAKLKLATVLLFFLTSPLTPLRSNSLRSHCLHRDVQHHAVRQLVAGQGADRQLSVLGDAELQQRRAGAAAADAVFQQANGLNGTKGREDGVEIEPQIKSINLNDDIIWHSLWMPPRS